MIIHRGEVDERDMTREADTAVYRVDFWRGDTFLEVRETESDRIVEVIDWARAFASSHGFSKFTVRLAVATNGPGEPVGLTGFLCHVEELRAADAEEQLQLLRHRSKGPSQID